MLCSCSSVSCDMSLNSPDARSSAIAGYAYQHSPVSQATQLTLEIEWQIAERCLVRRTLAQRAAVEVDVMRGTEDKHAFAVRAAQSEPVGEARQALTHMADVGMAA